MATTATAQDTIHLGGRTGGETRTTGRVVDYSGDGLVVELPGGRRQTFPAERVLRIETRRVDAHRQADEAFAEGDTAAAGRLYLAALEAETRRWVRSEIVAQLIRCHDRLGQSREAAELFVQLLGDDPRTPYFDCIPLGWLPGGVDTILQQHAAGWMRGKLPAVRLLGASYSLAGPGRAEATGVLNRLMRETDERIARLAAGQLWRTRMTPADQNDLQRLEGVIESLDEPLRGGPYFVLGSAAARAGQDESAALAWLRAAILHPEDRPLAARSLLEAGDALRRFGRNVAAGRLYREVVRDYNDQTQISREADARLQEAAPP